MNESKILLNIESEIVTDIITDIVTDIESEIVTDIIKKIESEITFERNFAYEIALNKYNNRIKYDLRYLSLLNKFEYEYKQILNEINEISFNNLSFKVKNFEYGEINEIIKNFESDFESEIANNNIKYYESDYNFVNTYKNDLYSLVSINYDLYKLNEYNLLKYFVISFKKYEYDKKNIFVVINNRFLNYIDNNILNYKFKGIKHNKAINICNNRLNNLNNNKRISKDKKQIKKGEYLRKLIIAERKQSDYKIAEYITNSYNKCYFNFLNNLTNESYKLFAKSTESDFAKDINKANEILKDFVNNNNFDNIESCYKYKFGDYKISDNTFYDEITEIYYNNNDFDKKICFKYIDKYFDNLFDILNTLKINEIKIGDLKNLLITYKKEQKEYKTLALKNQTEKRFFNHYQSYFADIAEIESEIAEIKNEIAEIKNEIGKGDFKNHEIAEIESEIEIAFKGYNEIKERYYKEIINDYDIYKYNIFNSEMNKHNSKIKKEQSDFLKIAFNESLNDFITTD